MNTSEIRQRNVARIFHHLREHPGSSQRDLAEVTGLDKATISAVVSQLDREGFIVRNPKTSKRAGRPEIALSIAQKAGIMMGLYLAEDQITITYSLLDGTPKMSQHFSIKAEDNIINLIERQLDSFARQHGYHADSLFAIGLSHSSDVEDLIQKLEQGFQTPVYKDSPIRAATLAEKLFGVCRTSENFLLVTDIQGVYAGLYLNNDVYNGHSGQAGALGHVNIVPEGRPCHCGGRGCLNTYASSPAIVQDLVFRKLAFHTINDVADAAEAGEAKVIEVLTRVGHYLGIAVGNLCQVLNMATVVLGGNFALLAPYILIPVQRSLKKQVMPALKKTIAVKVSPLEQNSMSMGGIALAMEGFLGLPR